jgi:hypothetical protein
VHFLAEAANPAPEPFADFGQFAGAEDDQDDHQNDQQFADAETEHEGPSRSIVDANRGRNQRVDRPP